MKKLNPNKLFDSFPAEGTGFQVDMSDARKKKGKKSGKDEELMEESSSQMGKKSKGISKDPNKPKRGQYGE